MKLEAVFQQPQLHVVFDSHGMVASTGIPVVREYIGAEPYEGSYMVIPLAWEDQELPTVNKLMQDNVLVKEIPYYEVSNPSGGMTVNIG